VYLSDVKWLLFLYIKAGETRRAIKNADSRDIGNTRHRTKTNKLKQNKPHGASHIDPTQALRLRVCFKFFVCLFCFNLLVFVLCLVLPMSLESAFLIALRVSPAFIYKNNNHYILQRLAIIKNK
jgi:hypothetical protein